MYFFVLTKLTTQKKQTWIKICFLKCNVRLLSWPIFVQCVSKPPRFCFSWWILVTETAEGNFSAVQSLAFGARINLGFCPSCAATQVDTMSLHTFNLSDSHVHQLQRKFISIFVTSFFDFVAMSQEMGSQLMLMLFGCLPSDHMQTCFASNDHEWKQKQIHELLAFLNFVVILTLDV